MELIYIALLSLILTIIIYPTLIKFLHQLKFGQSIRKEGPSMHQKKTGTPTMGGLGFVVTPLIAIAILRWDLLVNTKFLLLYLTFISYALIGFLDDFLIVVQKKNDGLKPKYKLLFQFLIAVIFFVFYQSQASTVVQFPFIKIDLGIFYFVLLMIMFVAESNAVNLTDGIDGLCATVYCVALIPFGVIAYYQQQYEVLTFIVALFFALIGYLKYNLHPAKVFMGDTGSLALGGVLAAIAVILKVELLLIVIGGVFLIETLSVMIQVAYYKKTKKRIFKMTPIHHHFEFLGWNEKQIVVRFALFGGVLAMIGVGLWMLY